MRSRYAVAYDISDPKRLRRVHRVMRGFGDPDVFLPTDLGAKHALDRIGLVVDAAENWRPWRSYALHHLWASL